MKNEKHLFKVEIEGDIYVLAKDGREAERQAKCHCDECELGYNAYEVMYNDYIGQDWTDCVPFGTKDYKKTCQEYLDEIKKNHEILIAKQEMDRKQLKFDFFEEVKN